MSAVASEASTGAKRESSELSASLASVASTGAKRESSELSVKIYKSKYRQWLTIGDILEQ